MENVGNDIINYSRAKAIVTAYENEMIEETYKNNKAREEGLEQGIEQGIEQGMEQAKIEIAKSMLEKKMDINAISEITGLQIEKITELI